MNHHHLPHKNSQAFHNIDNVNLNNKLPPNHNDNGQMNPYNSEHMIHKNSGSLYPQDMNHRTPNSYNEEFILNSPIGPPPILNQHNFRLPPNPPQTYQRFPHHNFPPPNLHQSGRPFKRIPHQRLPNVGSSSSFSFPPRQPSISPQNFRNPPNLQFTRPPPGYPPYVRSQNSEMKQERYSFPENINRVESADDYSFSLNNQNSPQNKNLGPNKLNSSGQNYHPLHGSVLSFKKDEKNIDEWVQQELKNSSKSKLTNDSTSIPGNLKKVFNDVDNFRCCLKDLKRGDISSLLQEKMEDVSSRISSSSYQARVKKLVNDRRKKRIRQRNAKKKRKEEILLKHKIIDEQMKTVIESEQRIKKQKEQKEEADFILKEVNSKESECSNLLKVLTKVTELRENRLKRGAEQGYVADEIKDSQFKNTIESLHNMITSRMEEYSAKKRSLKAKIEEHQNCPAVTERSEKCKNITTEDISDIYFGSRSPRDLTLYQSFTAAKTSSEMENRRRYLWNSYLSEEGSEIPVQWALPNTEEGEWEKWREEN